MAAPFIDIHTHDHRADSGLYSWGIHPWHVEECRDLSALEALLKEGRLAAIGETGIDRGHKATIPLQLESFERHIVLSEQYGKPLIIHNVGGTADVLRLHKKHHPRQKWIMHGFNGTVEEVAQLSDKGIGFSVGEAIFYPNRKIHTSIKSIPLDCLFLETDVSGRTIQEVYAQAAVLLDLPLEDLRQRIFTNFNSLNLSVWKTGKTVRDCSSETRALINLEKAMC